MRTPLPINLEALLRGRAIEGERVEYKAGWNPESVLHTICAFANDFHNLGGGYLVIGVEEENGRPVLPPKGIAPDRVDALQKELLQLGHQAIQPTFHPLSASYTVDGRTVLVIWAPGGETRPYKCRVSLAKDGKDWAWYIRVGSSTVRARGADERELLGLAATVPFDDRRNLSASIDNLSRRLIGEFLDQVGSELSTEAPTQSMELLGRQMNIIGGPSEEALPKNVGLLFSTTNRTVSSRSRRSMLFTSRTAPAVIASRRRSSRVRSDVSPRTPSTMSHATTSRRPSSNTPIDPRRSASGIFRVSPSRKPSSMRYTTAPTRNASRSRFASVPKIWSC